jgi:hypothetical protein
MVTEIVYTWPTGRQEVRYRRTTGTPDEEYFVSQVDELRERLGENCPYSYRRISEQHTDTSSLSETQDLNHGN